MDPSDDGPSEVEIPNPYPMDIELPPAPSNRTRKYYAGKLPLIQPLAGQTDDQGNEIFFGAYQQSSLVLLADATLEALQSSKQILASFCEIISDVPRFFILGPTKTSPSESLPPITLSTNNEPVSPAASHPVTTQTEEPESTTDIPPHRDTLFGRTLRNVRVALRHLSTPLVPEHQDLTPASVVPGSSSRKRPRADSTVPAATPLPATSSSATTDRRRQAVPRNQKKAKEAKERDGERGKFTNLMSGIEAAHIIPHSINATPEALHFFYSMLAAITTVFGSAFAERLKTLLGSPGSSDKLWNLITLDAYTHKLYDSGYIGFYPIKLVEINNERDMGWKVYFSIHWFGRTKISKTSPIKPTEVTLFEMAKLAEAFFQDQNSYRILDSTTGTCVAEGAVDSIFLNNLEDAHNMFTCLMLSWVMRTIYFGAAASGEPDDPADDIYDRPREANDLPAHS